MTLHTLPHLLFTSVCVLTAGQVVAAQLPERPLPVIRGNGVQNVQRLCWNRLDTWMTSDIPSEARWRSLNWGVFKLINGK